VTPATGTPASWPGAAKSRKPINAKRAVRLDGSFCFSRVMITVRMALVMITFRMALMVILVGLSEYERERAAAVMLCDRCPVLQV
jgi:hypothetical protein